MTEPQTGFCAISLGQYGTLDARKPKLFHNWLNTLEHTQGISLRMGHHLIGEIFHHGLYSVSIVGAN